MSPKEKRASLSKSAKMQKWSWWVWTVLPILFVSLIVGVGVRLIRIDGLSFQDYIGLIGPSALTASGALIAALILYYRWRIDHVARIEMERQRLLEENRRHREQERGKRRENLGTRLSKAIDHIGDKEGVIQVAGLTELAGLVDDWWAIGQETLEDLGDGEDSDAVKGEVSRRRQELVDMLFKQPLLSVETADVSSEEKQRREIVQKARERILRSHLILLDNTVPFSEPFDEDSWHHFDFSGAELNHAKIANAYLAKTDFQMAQLEDANLDKAHLEGAELGEAHLEGAEMFEAHLEGAKLRGAHLEGADLFGAHLEGAKLRGAHLEGAEMFEAHLEGADLFRAHLEGAELGEAHLEGAKLRGAHLEGADLFGAHLEGAELRGAHLEGAELRGAHLEGAELRGAHLEGADLRGAHLDDANLSQASLDTFYDGEPKYSVMTIFPTSYDLENSGFVLVDD